MSNGNIIHFHNSIVLLGECYNRFRINNEPIEILGHALFELLLKHLVSRTKRSKRYLSHEIYLEFAGIILNQVRLNGPAGLAQQKSRETIEKLQLVIERCLSQVSHLWPILRHVFEMILDDMRRVTGTSQPTQHFSARLITDRHCRIINLYNYANHWFEDFFNYINVFRAINSIEIV